MLTVILIFPLALIARKVYRNEEEGSRIYEPNKEKYVNNTENHSNNEKAITDQPEGFSQIAVLAPTTDVQLSAV